MEKKFKSLLLTAIDLLRAVPDEFVPPDHPFWNDVKDIVEDGPGSAGWLERIGIRPEDGWVQWFGIGDRPTDAGVLVDIVYPDGDIGQDFSDCLRWDWMFEGLSGGDIVAYRVIE